MDAPLVSVEDFARAKTCPVLPPRAAEKIVKLLATEPCFTCRAHAGGGGAGGVGGSAHRGGHAPPGGSRPRRWGSGGAPSSWGADAEGNLRADRGGGARRQRALSGRGAAPSSDDGSWTHLPQQATRPPLAGVHKDAVVGNLNKLTRANYAVILPKIRGLLSDGNLVDAVRRILCKAYREPDSTLLCINILHDIYEGLGDAARREADRVVAGSVDETVDELRERVVLPSFDPAQDYGGFCDVNVAKRTAVGRSRTLYPLLARGLIGPGAGGDAGHARGSADRFFTKHVELLGSLVEEAAGVPGDDGAGAGAGGPKREARSGGLDVLAAVEVLLECCEVMVSEQAGNIAAVRAMVRSVGGAQAFPTARARFKVIDLLAKDASPGSDKERPAKQRNDAQRWNAPREVKGPARDERARRDAKPRGGGPSRG